MVVHFQRCPATIHATYPTTIPPTDLSPPHRWGVTFTLPPLPLRTDVITYGPFLYTVCDARRALRRGRTELFLYDGQARRRLIVASQRL